MLQGKGVSADDLVAGKQERIRNTLPKERDSQSLMGEGRQDGVTLSKGQPARSAKLEDANAL